MENITNETQDAYIQNYETVMQHLFTKFQKEAEELENALEYLKKLREMLVVLDNLKKGLDRLSSFAAASYYIEHDEGLKAKKVEQLELLEKDLMSNADELEKLGFELLDAEKRAGAPPLFGDDSMGGSNVSQPQ
ncbi:uncharacterized protein LOC127264996 [Andrographis paniculata]|uniref:uncharacterized protein LOC127264996 n=1 Tax=Andrographis paniculata TaxID=175694 RepID=UPI0021E85746|nr:uncharacterized protein LOC127264996 [Andrographis paniculata]